MSTPNYINTQNQTPEKGKDNHQPSHEHISEFDYYEKIDNGICPQCDQQLSYNGGCKQCNNCAWAVC